MAEYGLPPESAHPDEVLSHLITMRSEVADAEDRYILALDRLAEHARRYPQTTYRVTGKASQVVFHQRSESRGGMSRSTRVPVGELTGDDGQPTERVYDDVQLLGVDWAGPFGSLFISSDPDNGYYVVPVHTITDIEVIPFEAVEENPVSL